MGRGGTIGVYKMIRPFFRYTETCHFCCQDCTVTYEQLNDFMCPHCDQYNGWDGEGNSRRHLLPGSTASFAANRRTSSGKSPDNGLCRNCNLNQELKIAQLSSSNSEGFELDEYAAHLERAYRLCASCEDLVASKLRSQDAKLAPSVLEFRLERSRLERSRGGGKAITQRQQLLWSLCCKTIILMQAILAIVCISMILDHTRLLDQLASWHPALEGLYLVSDLLCTLLLNHDLALLLVLITAVALQLIRRYVTTETTLVAKSSKPGGDSFKARLSSTSFCQPDILEQEGTITQGLDDLSNFEEPSPSPPSLFHPLSSTPTMSNPLKTRDEVTINHEFALVDNKCDISVLSLGSPPSSPMSATTARAEAFPSVPRQYSPPPSSTLSLFSPKRPLLRPSRLTSSWVAGGYWTPPSQQQQPVTISRSSSQSSGFASATPSVNNFSATPSINNFFPPPSQRGSVLNFPTSLALNRAESDRFSLASEPLASHLLPQSPTSRRSQFATPRHHQQLDRVSQSSADNSQAGDHLASKSMTKMGGSSSHQKEGWTFTITLTPAHLLLALSVAVNVALGVLWANQ